jgi:hypothetical protein
MNAVGVVVTDIWLIGVKKGMSKMQPRHVAIVGDGFLLRSEMVSTLYRNNELKCRQ